MSTQAIVPETCTACAAALDRDQRYCLHCGEPRPGARRPMPAALRAPAVPEPRVEGAPAGGVVREGPSVGAALAGLACLLLAMGIGVLIGRDAGKPAAQQAVVAAAPVVASPAPASFESDWPAGKEGWTVALALLPTATTTPAAIAEAKAAAAAKGVPTPGALDAAAYPSLTAGSYVVYSGVFDTEAAATAARATLVAAFPDARVVRIAKDAATAAGTTTTGSTSKSASSKSEKKSTGSEPGASDTTNEVEKSKKAPKTVGTGGKPPPKDNKPAAGGGDFEEIG